MTNNKYSKEIIKSQLKEAEKVLGRMPTYKWWKQNYKKYGWCSDSPILLQFYSWNNALDETFNCLNRNPRNKPHQIQCFNCNKQFFKQPAQIQRSKSGNHFCSRSCAATYNNQNKSHGTRRSKLEIWLEEQLTTLYPDLEFHFNRKDTINSELDIYIPSLKLAFELNGIFHYEPIFGESKLQQIQNNDDRKFQACLEQGIELCIIDTSNLKYMKPKKFQKYLNIICDIINDKLLNE